jgi:two-component system response regulator YesN
MNLWEFVVITLYNGNYQGYSRLDYDFMVLDYGCGQSRSSLESSPESWSDSRSGWRVTSKARCLLMYQLLIVDDEASVRSGLRECVNWSQYGIEVMGEAEDGIDALALLAASPAHIVITDVKMPHMDGLTLSAKLRESYADIKIIFISGFDDLDYIKSALKLDAIDYILKPLQLDELKMVVTKVTLLLQEEETRLHKLNELNMKLNQSIPLLRERFLVALVNDGINRNEHLPEKFDFLGIRLHPYEGSYCVFIVKIDDYQSARSKTERDRQLLSFALLNICEDVMNGGLLGHVFETRPGEYAGILNLFTDSDEEQLYNIVNECREQLNRILKLQVTIGVGSTVNNIMSLPHSYRLAAEAAEHKWFLGKNQIITIDSLGMDPGELTIGSLPDIRQFVAILKSDQSSAATSYLDEWFRIWNETRHLSIKSCQNGCIQLMLACSNLLIDLDIDKETINKSERQLWEIIHRVETIMELKKGIAAHVELVQAAITQKRERKTKNGVAQIQSYIQEHYTRELTIAEIASSVYLTTTYICLLFKQETGMTINEYIIEIRIAKAKEMLGDFRNKLYDICFAVGYKDPAYFSKLFKKQTGFSPTEFRDKML